MTYGEYKRRWKEESQIKNGVLEFCEKRAPKRMSPQEAIVHYTRKLRAVWEKLGYKEKEMVVKEPDSLAELQKKAENESFERRGKAALIANYAKRMNMTYEEAAEALGYKSTAPLSSMVKRGVIEGDPDKKTVDDESLKRFKLKRDGAIVKDEPVKQKEPETKGFKVEEEPAAQTTVKKYNLMIRWVEKSKEEFDELPGEALGLITKDELVALVEKRAGELTALTPDWERVDEKEIGRFANDARGFITLGALKAVAAESYAMGKESTEKSGLKKIILEVARGVA